MAGSRGRLRSARVLPRVLSVVILILAATLIVVIASSPALNWAVVKEYLFAQVVLRGIATTLYLTVVAMVLGALIGTVLALLLTSPDRLPRTIARSYVWLFRGVPLLVQLLFWFNLATIIPSVHVVIPFIDVTLIDSPTNRLITPLMAAVLAFALHEGAYMAEIIRAGFQAVPVGEIEAGQSLGFNRWQVFRRIKLPQAMGVVLPPTGNQVIITLKTTALVSFIAVQDLLYSVQIVYSRTFQVIPLLLVATIWYLIFVTALTLIQRRVEKRFNRWRRPDSRPTKRRVSPAVSIAAP